MNMYSYEVEVWNEFTEQQEIFHGFVAGTEYRDAVKAVSDFYNDDNINILTVGYIQEYPIIELDKGSNFVSIIENNGV